MWEYSTLTPMILLIALVREKCAFESWLSLLKTWCNCVECICCCSIWLAVIINFCCVHIETPIMIFTISSHLAITIHRGLLIPSITQRVLLATWIYVVAGTKRARSGHLHSIASTVTFTGDRITLAHGLRVWLITVIKIIFENHVVVILLYISSQVEVLSQEAHKFMRWPIVSKLCCLHTLVL